MGYIGNYFMVSSSKEVSSINLFTTSDSPNIRIPILQIFVFVIEGGQENIFLLVENIFWTNEKTKIWRIGIRIFGGSDVVNKLVVAAFCQNNYGQRIRKNEFRNSSSDPLMSLFTSNCYLK